MCEILNYEVWIVDAMAFYVFPCSIHWLHTMSTDTRIACLGDLLTGDQFGSSSEESPDLRAAVRFAMSIRSPPLSADVYESDVSVRLP